MLAALAACSGDLDVPGGGTLTTAELLILPLQAAAPPVSQTSFFARNARLTVGRLQHADDVSTLYVELRFPSGALASLNGTPVGADDSVMVTVQPAAGQYGFTLSPNGLAFTLDVTPTAEFFFGRFGDLTVADNSPRYATRIAYAQALELWFEVTPGRWQAARSASAGPDAIIAPVDEPGTYVLAAPR